MRIFCLLFFFSGAFQPMLLALGPHECALIVNANSADSVSVAGHYAHLRGIPKRNIVQLDLPEEFSNENQPLSAEEFTRFIWEPVQKTLLERGLSEQVLAWVYSLDFPHAIQAKGVVVSINGLTWLKNELPDHDMAGNAKYLSPLFADNSGPNTPVRSTQTLDVSRSLLKDKMPLPNMMLGVSGVRGNSIQEIQSYLARSKQSDGSRPKGNVYFVVSKDVRSTCREWQYERAAADLNELGIGAQIVSAVPAGQQDIAGIMMGASVVDLPESSELLSGALADHLTSFAGTFKEAKQTKLTYWLKRGAAGACGTVTEPYAIWPKFPHGRVFVHYARGCTLIESLASSLRCPLQLLLVGDPLASPWRPDNQLSVQGLNPVQSINSTARISISVSGKKGYDWNRFTLLVDGVYLAEIKKDSFALELRTLQPGKHLFRVVAHRNGLINHQLFIEKEFILK